MKLNLIERQVLQPGGSRGPLPANERTVGKFGAELSALGRDVGKVSADLAEREAIAKRASIVSESVSSAQVEFSSWFDARSKDPSQYGTLVDDSLKFQKEQRTRLTEGLDPQTALAVSQHLNPFQASQAIHARATASKQGNDERIKSLDQTIADLTLAAAQAKGPNELKETIAFGQQSIDAQMHVGTITASQAQERQDKFRNTVYVNQIERDLVDAPQEVLAALKNKENYADLRPDLRNHLMARAASAVKSQEAERAATMRVVLNDKLGDMEAMALKGNVPPENYITPAEVSAAYPKNPAHVALVNRQVQNAYKLGVQTSQMPGLSDGDIVSLVTSEASPSMSRPENFAEDAAHQAKLQTMAAHVITQRRKDPIAFASTYGDKIGMPKVNQLDISSQENFTAELANRQQVSKLMSERFGSPPKLLADAEAPMLTHLVKEAPLNNRLGVLLNISRSVNDPQAYRGLMNQIAPDDPVTATAGTMAEMGQRKQSAQALVAARDMLRGQAILRQDKKEDGQPVTGKILPMPPDKEMLADFEDYARDSFSGNENKRNAAYQASRAIYAKMSVDDAGDYTGTYDNTRWKAAMQEAIGNVDNHRGKRIALPYGYDYGQFKNELRQRVMGAADSLSDPESWYKLMDLPLEPAGDGKYAFRSGDALMVDKTGKRIVMDFNAPIPKSTAPRASEFIQGLLGLTP